MNSEHLDCHYKYLYDQSPFCLEIFDSEGYLIHMNTAGLELFGVDNLEDLSGYCLYKDTHINPKILKEIKKGNEVKFLYKYDFNKVKFKTKNQGIAYLETQLSPIKDHKNELIGYTALITNVTKKRKIEEKLIYASMFDALTGLYNRRYFNKKVAYLIKNNIRFCICVADIDGLKRINDNKGHKYGDELIVTAAKTIQSIIRKGDNSRKADIAARMGGDEFGIIFTGCNSKDSRLFEKRIRQAIKVANKLRGKNNEISISLGFAGTDEVSNINETWDLADNRMYEDKMLKDASVHSAIIGFVMDELESLSKTLASHSRSVSSLAEAMGEALKLHPSELLNLRVAALLHDIGKNRVPDIILNKTEKLTDMEMDLIRKHVFYGRNSASILLKHTSRLKHLNETTPEVILYHHENWDGTGYIGLVGEEIPLMSRIIRIADSFDAATHNRIAHNAKSVETTLAELKHGAGKEYDPLLVNIFIENMCYLNSSNYQA